MATADPLSAQTTSGPTSGPSGPASSPAASPAPPGASMPAGTRRVGPRTVVASLWLFAILNYLYCDVLSLYHAQHLRELLTGTVGGVAMTEGFLLGASVLMTVPMGAVLVARIAPHRVARWTSVVAGGFMTVVQLGSLTFGSTPTPSYLYFSAIEVTTTVVIAWYAARRWTVDA